MAFRGHCGIIPRRVASKAMGKLELYRWAVQDPVGQVNCLAGIYQRYRRRLPKRLREDFAGTSADCVHWLWRGGELAVAVDIDGPTLRFARRRARRILGDRDVRRLQFVRADVLRVLPPKVPRVDVVSVGNFSIFLLPDRSALRAYFRGAWRGLRREGMVAVLAFGGPGFLGPRVKRRRVARTALYAVEPPPDAFDYYWEQLGFDAVGGRLDCRMHFITGRRRERRSWRNAFRYTMRVWTLPELTDAMKEAGFTRTEVWYQPAARRRNAVMRPVERIDSRRDWVAYVIGLR
jgi:SAM-dependent methyltransferase